jgi:hypothetical protein
MVNFKFGINFEFIRDKSVDKLVKEHEYELLKLKKELDDKLLDKSLDSPGV